MLPPAPFPVPTPAVSVTLPPAAPLLPFPPVRLAFPPLPISMAPERVSLDPRPVVARRLPPLVRLIVPPLPLLPLPLPLPATIVIPPPRPTLPVALPANIFNANGAVPFVLSAPKISNCAFGDVDPMPTFPFASTVMRVEVEVPPVVEAIVKSGVFAGVVAELEMERMEYGDVVPRPSLPVEEMKILDVACAVPASLPTRK